MAGFTVATRRNALPSRISVAATFMSCRRLSVVKYIDELDNFLGFKFEIWIFGRKYQLKTNFLRKNINWHFSLYYYDVKKMMFQVGLFARQTKV